jgi:hypothetical protein
MWVEDPASTYERGLFPLRLLRPEDLGSEVRTWCDSATRGDVVASRELELRIQGFRALITGFNIPFLSLPTRTKREVALDVFIKTNTSYVRLTPFDIVVAEVEAATERSLQDLLARLRSSVPEVDAYSDPSELILGIAALRQDKPPTQASYFSLDLHRLVDEWELVIDGVRWLVEVLAAERILDGARLPTVGVLPVIAALHGHMAPALDDRGFARRLTRRYLWRSCLTWRYTSAAATNAFQDFRALRDVVADQAGEDRVPVFDEHEYPHPVAVEDLDRLRWPKAKPIVARGMLAVTLKAGALDIADGSEVNRENITHREYHHLFPQRLLLEAGLERFEIFRALNCALVTWNTNRDIGAKEPLAYLRERTRRTRLGDELGEQAVRSRLASHLIPFDELSVGGYDEIADESRRRDRIAADFERFLEARADLILPAIATLCSGDEWPRV